MFTNCHLMFQGFSARHNSFVRMVRSMNVLLAHHLTVTSSASNKHFIQPPFFRSPTTPQPSSWLYYLHRGGQTHDYSLGKRSPMSTTLVLTWTTLVQSWLQQISLSIVNCDQQRGSHSYYFVWSYAFSF